MSALLNLSRIRSIIRPIFTFRYGSVRYLYSQDILQLTEFQQTKDIVLKQLGPNRALFFEKIKKTLDEKLEIFTKDFRYLIMLTETDEEIQLMMKVRDLYKEQQRKALFPGFFRSAEYILQMLYVNNKVDTAFQWFQDERTTVEHDAANSDCFLLMMDMLYEAGRYDDVISLMAQVDVYLNYNCPALNVLYFAALYRKNTKTALSQAMSRLQDYCEKETLLPNRCMFLSALLAYNQGDFRTMLEIEELPLFYISRTSPRSKADNIKLLAFAEFGRLEECVSSLQCCLINLAPQYKALPNIFPDVMERLAQVVEEKGTVELKESFYTVRTALNRAKIIAPITSEQYVCGIVRDVEYKTMNLMQNQKSLKAYKGFLQTMYKTEKINRIESSGDSEKFMSNRSN